MATGYRRGKCPGDRRPFAEWGLAGHHGEGPVGSDGGDDGVARQGREVRQQTLEAVDGEAVFGASSGAFGESGGGAFGLGDEAGSQGLGGLFVVVVIEHRREAGAQVPFEIVGEHAQEHMCSDGFLQPMIDRSDVEIDGLETTKGALDIP